MSLPRYEKYKDSGVEWLGEVPEHWDLGKLKRLASICYGIGEPPAYRGDGIPLIRATDIRAGKITPDGIVFVDPKDIPEKRIVWLREGDIIVVRSGAYTGDSAIIPKELIPSIAGFDMVLRPEKCFPRFLQFVLLSSYMKEAQIDLERTRAAQPHLNAEELGSCLMLIPPMDQQAVISGFLDRETVKIGALVEEQRRLIELLQEKRQAVISHAVTKGLNPDAPMKNSGIEWLGEVPEHWNVCALNYRYEVALGKMLDEKRITGEHLAPYLRNIDVQWGKVNTEDLPEMDFKGDDLSRYSLSPGDLLVCEGGEVGRAAVWQGELTECFYQKALHRLRVRSETDSARFLFYVLHICAKFGVFAGSEGRATFAHLTAETFRRYRFPFPPRSEQAAITEFLDGEALRFDELIAEATHAIDLLQERRTALISAAVTGKIDVRGLSGTEAA